MSRSLLVVVVVGAVLAGGCYGSTEPATDIGEDSATLNARGTANKGPATTRFEYWADRDLGDLTPDVSWPAGVSGPFSEKVTKLFVATQYSFRLCGYDNNRPSLVCAQTRTFSTPPFAGDYVQGNFYVPQAASGRRFRARSGPAGENARGEVRFSSGGTFVVFSDVTCLKVSNNRAIVGTADAGSSLLYAVQDGPDSYAFRQAPTNPPNCSSFTFEEIGQQGTPSASDVVIIHDEP